MAAQAAGPARLIIVDPGHFHATLLQKEMYAGLADRVSVYAPLGPELLEYLSRISLFNSRPENPTHWNLDIHTSSDPMREMLRDRPGNVVLFTGRNRGKIDRILASLEGGLNVFADKPWIITSDEIPKLEHALDLADKRGLIGYDIMTERYEVTSQLQRELVNTPDVFGRLVPGTEDNPAISAKSIHNIMKVVAGVPLRRPTWFFDVGEYGEALTDVGTHVVDLVQWTAFPDQAIDYQKDIAVHSGRHWPLEITRDQFRQVTGQAAFPKELANHISGETLHYFCNNSVDYTLRGARVHLEILWNWETPQGGDSYQARFRGSSANIEIRQGAAEKFIPELYVVASAPTQAKEVFGALRKKVAALQSRWPGLSVEEKGSEARLVIPDKFRVGHEAHFAEVSNHFLGFLGSPGSLPKWERPCMLAKYYVTTTGVALARAKD